jgi:hypothetical protein
VTIKVVFSDHGDHVTNELMDILGANPILAPLIGDEGFSGHYNSFGEIPRHHPELVRVIEKTIKETANYSLASIEIIEGPRYFITEAEGREWVWSEESFVDASLPLDPEIVRMAPHNFSDPDWDLLKELSCSPYNRDWKHFVPDNIKVLWSTFTEEQKANLSIHFDQLLDEMLDRQPT